MKLAQKIILAIGALTLIVLFWKMDAGAVLELVLHVGWGFAIIIVQETGAHCLNALGWRYAMRPETVPHYPYRELFKLRIIGDGVNYLTPSATIAGEFARAAQLNDSQPFDVRLAGVVAAKFAQALSQMLFVLFGIAWVLRGKIAFLEPYEGAIRILAAGAAACLIGFVLWEKSRPLRHGGREIETPRDHETAPSGLRGMPKQLRYYLRDHPGRAAVSTLLFMLGYAWNAIEVYLIAHFLNVPVTWHTALAIEVLSNMIDGMLFFVPAKVGTQEAGKTAIFAMLGMPARAGFAFGIVRHIRELTWGSFGLLLYSLRVKRSGRGGSPEPDREALAPVKAMD